MQKKDRDRILDWLPCSDHWHFYNEASASRLNHSAGEWFTQGQFKKWINDPGSLLWLYAGGEFRGLGIQFSQTETY